MYGLKADILRGCWYVALASRDLKAGALAGRTIAGEPVVIGRSADGAVFALRDTCPHRGIPLRYGRMIAADTIECCYHGWQFGTDGVCRAIPSLRQGQQIELGKIRCITYPAVERYGAVWVYLALKDEAPAEGFAPEPPVLPELAFADRPQATVSMEFPNSVDQAVFGTMDPSHVAFVHTSRWYRKEARVMRDKEKSFEPDAYGFRMTRHTLPNQNVLYQRLLGDGVTSEIDYQLPGYRVEHIKGGRNWIVGLTALTPVSEDTTVLHQMFYTSLGWVAPLGRVFEHFTKVFLRQDWDVAAKQREGLVSDPRVMLINDSDTQARWWMRLKHEWTTAQAEGRLFANPLRPQTLRFRS
ncbi:Rieske 2Fe-2S domain-containing protein [Faunimonas sp. B44]|uniref:Rieske 2Fe-2S domain-containing protein n=1 Tax=Faunimonas sp. B44 TaxID=3461493 RepID=UPI00404474ED